MFLSNILKIYLCNSNDKTSSIMKKSFPILIVLIMIGNLAHSQFFYTRIGVGITGSIAANRGMLYSYSNDGSTTTVYAVPVGLGRGFTGSAVFGFKPNKYFGLELGISEFLGLARTGDSVSHFPGGGNLESKIRGNMFSLLPAIVISPGLKHVDPYARLGMVIGIRPTILATADYSQASTNPPNEYHMVRQYYGNIAVGLNAAMGVNWTVNNLISLYAEFTFTSINYNPNYSEVIHFEKNGVDELSTLTVKQTKTEYYNSLNPNEQIPDTSPDKAFKLSIPFSSAGLAFGIAFHF